jgi:hypothetical protein
MRGRRNEAPAPIAPEAQPAETVHTPPAADAVAKAVGSFLPAFNLE